MNEVKIDIQEAFRQNMSEGGSCSAAEPCDQVLAEHTITVSWNTAKLDDRQRNSDLTQRITVQVTP